MFDDIERMLGGLENTIRIPISIPLDDDGNLDRLCPHPQCRHAFKVLFDDWEAKVSNEKAFCPLCRHDAEPTDFNTPELDEYIGEVSLAHAAGLIDDTMSRMAQAFNATQSRNDFISVKMSYEPGARPVLMPPEAAEQMRQKFECEQCSCHYSSVGAAFFCPACGHNSSRSTFDQTVALVRKVLASIDDIAATVEKKPDSDSAKDYVRETLEGLVGRLIGAFQRLAEAVFDEHPHRAQFKPRRNVFQLPHQNLWVNSGSGRRPRLW
jgi:hypothetical protein